MKALCEHEARKEKTGSKDITYASLSRDRGSQRFQRVEVTMHGSLRHAEFDREGLGRHWPSAATEVLYQSEKTIRSGHQIGMPHVRGCSTLGWKPWMRFHPTRCMVPG